MAANAVFSAFSLNRIFHSGTVTVPRNTQSNLPSDVSTPSDTTMESARPAIQKHRRLSGSSNSAAIGWGLAITVVFYIVAPQIPGTQAFVARFFTGHPVEYVATAMFFIGLIILWTKTRRLGPERSALNHIYTFSTLPEFEPGAAPRSQIIEKMHEWLAGRSAAESGTVLARRVEDALHYVRGGRHSGLEEHLRYLADLATDRLHQSFALMRTISWAIPILGFLGTVMGITIAIANVTPEQLDTSLPEVTAGLAIAFDTTAQALAMSIMLVFGSFLVERVEQAILNDVEQFGIDHLLTWLPDDSAASAKENGPPSVFSDWTTSVMQQQTQFWSRHLSDLQAGWSNALAAQTSQLSRALDQETQATLEMHRTSVDDARDTYTAILQSSTQQFSEQLHQSLDTFGRRVELWQEAMITSSLSSARQMEELHRLGQTLLQLTESEQRLAKLQQMLNDNLQSLQIVDTLEQTVSSLNAAVHVLTAKSHIRSAA